MGFIEGEKDIISVSVRWGTKVGGSAVDKRVFVGLGQHILS